LVLHASRQLSDKVLRYLKRVIVAPAVYRSFVPLYRAFRCRHWAGFSGHTQLFSLAATYVFIKQSELPGHCDQTSSSLAPLLPKLRGKFAEFPRSNSRRHALGFSPRGTCVSSRYDPQLPSSTFHGPPASEEDSLRSPFPHSPGSHHDGTSRGDWDQIGWRMPTLPSSWLPRGRFDLRVTEY